MGCVRSFIILGLIVFTGCQATHKPVNIENQIRVAIHQGQPAEYIDQLMSRVDDPSRVATMAAFEVMDLDVPRNIKISWDYFREYDISSTPTIEIYEVVNRYKIAVLRVLISYGIDLNQDYDDRPIVHWRDNPATTPELLTFLLDHGYDANANNNSSRGLDLWEFCGPWGSSLLRDEQKYEMLKLLLKHGVNPNVMSRGMPILHRLILYKSYNPLLLDTLQLFLDAGADVNVVDKQGKTVLDIALSGKNDELTLKIVDMLKGFDAKRGVEL